MTPMRWAASSRRDLGGGLLGVRGAARDLERAVDRGEVGARAGLDDVGRDAAAGDAMALDVDLHDDVAERVGPAGDARHVEAHESGLDAGRTLDRAHRGVDEPVAERRLLDRLLTAAKANRRARLQMRPAAHLDRLHHEKILIGGAELLGHDRVQVLIGQLDLAVGELLEPRERAVQVLLVELDAELAQRVGERVAPGVLAEDQPVALEADLERVHDLVGGRVREHAVLVDAALVRERRRAHDRLVGLHRVAGRHDDEPGRAHDLAHVELVRHAERLAAGAHDHRDLLERAVPRALADPVHRRLDLPGAVRDPGERVRHGQPQVVVAVRRDRDVVGNGLAHDPHELAELVAASRSRPCPAR